MKKRSSIIYACFAVLLIIATMTTRTEARTGSSVSGKGKAKDIAAYGKYDTRRAESDRDITSTKTYIVKKGDTIYAIARKFGIAPDSILEINRCSTTKIIPGMKLKIPVHSAKKKTKTSDRPAAAKGKNAPDFQWPLKKVKTCRKDGEDGVKSIGIIINSAPNAEVLASEKGVVKKIGYMRGYGKYIVVMHKSRYITVYSNIDKVNVREGQSVKKGSVLGRISNDSLLHFQIGKAGKPENPLEYLPSRS
ncbi:MAG TPA: LysM peptidoglycan-binding domain-containing M23 family metallopeptidase [Spirochaetota bacterium]|nr:LysM peptidoglycan-binding domain-containing M23 family metallopeptidase [Spirochaetota bacterium]HQO41047.1 LysM peptidoglycan-binding domain-containing M23 family metallopeptidase [Spirochaetota bacterium]